MSRPVEKKWWKEAVVYQIYPASFLDTNGDGLGDVKGIISKVDYIKDLGADAIWLSPIFASPQKDMGYDIADYRSIHPPYGTVADVEELIEKLHSQNMKLLLDLVVNHTSDEHSWFKESRSSRDNPKREWYFWRDPKYDADGKRSEPNNWKSIFGGSAWHYDEATDQYYLALFLPSQPDLNWENAEMREATYNDMRFWLDRGVDGFRIDSMNLMSKHPELPDGKIVFAEELYQSGAEWFASGPKMHDYIREMRTKVFDNYDIMTVGELGFTKDELSVSQYVAKDRHELNMVFTGDIVDMDFGPDGKYDRCDFHPSTIRRITNMWQTAMPRFDGWNSVYLDNHDSGRSISRYASDAPEHRAMAAKMLATYLCSLSGTPFLLAGQEIGMANLSKDYGIESYIDVEGRNHYAAVLKARGGDVSQMGDVMRELQLKARDHGRLPMQWSSQPNAGFCAPTVHPWMTVNRDHTKWNVESQLDDVGSVRAYWKHILSLRKKYAEILIYGAFEMLREDVTGERVLAYERTNHEDDKQKMVVFLNFSGDSCELNAEKYDDWTILVQNGTSDGVVAGKLRLEPYSAIILTNVR